MEKALAYLTEHRDRHLSELRVLCKMPSISTRPENAAHVRKAVEWTRDRCSQAGLTSELHETDRHPLVYAEWLGAGPNAPTVLVYGHVDVQPEGDRKLWDADPFDPVVKGDWLICRGSADDKGQVLLYVRAVEAWLKTTGKLPINIKMLIEAEEEIGSPNLEPFIRKNAAKLKCDLVLISDTSLLRDGYPAVTVSTRGLVYKEVFLTGPKNDLHSGAYGGAVVNPANALTWMIARMHDADGRVTVPGFYDGIAAPTDAQRRELAAAGRGDADLLAETGAPALWSGERGFTAWERRSIRPTLDVNGMTSGFQGEGANTIIPARASAKISMRLVAGQDAEKIGAAFDAHVKSLCPPGLKLEIRQHGPGANAYAAPADSKALSASCRALQEAFGQAPAMLSEGGSLPILPMFKQVLGADSILLGFASPDCGAHGPNEKANLPDLDRGANAIARLFAYL